LATITSIILLACDSISVIVAWYLARLSSIGGIIGIGLIGFFAGLLEILSLDIFLESAHQYVFSITFVEFVAILAL
jgi:hypothetical protein